MKPVKFWAIIALIVFAHIGYLLFGWLVPFLPGNITLFSGVEYPSEFFLYDFTTQLNFVICSSVMLMLAPKKMRFIFGLLLAGQTLNLVKYALLGEITAFYFLNLVLVAVLLVYAAYNYKLWRYVGIDGSTRYALTMNKTRPIDYVLQPGTEALSQADLIRQTDTAEDSFAQWVVRLNQLADELDELIEKNGDDEGKISRKAAKRVANKLRIERNAGRYHQQYATEELSYTKVNIKDAVQLNRQKYGAYFCGVATNMKAGVEYEIYVNRSLFKGAITNVIMSATRNYEGKPEDFQASFTFNESSTSYHFLFSSIGNFSEIDGPTLAMEEKAAQLAAQMGGEMEVRHKPDRRTVEITLPSPGPKDPNVCISFRDLIP